MSYIAWTMARKLTDDEAKALFDGGWWKEMDQAETARLQLHQDRLCMPFSDFHAAMEKLLGRPVWTHEFADPDALIAEAEGKREAPLDSSSGTTATQQSQSRTAIVTEPKSS